MKLGNSICSCLERLQQRTAYRSVHLLSHLLRLAAEVEGVGQFDVAVPTVCLEIFVRTVRVECMLERLSELPVGEGRYEIDLRKEIPLAVRTFQSVIDGSLFYTQRSSIDDFIPEIDIRRKTEIPQIDIGIEVARQVTATEIAHGVNGRIVVSYIARQTERPVERVRGRQYRPIVVDVPTVGERLDEIGILCIIVVDHRIMLQPVLEDGRKPRFLYLAGIIQV